MTPLWGGGFLAQKENKMKQRFYTESLITSIILTAFNLVLVLINYVIVGKVYTILWICVVFWLFVGVYSLIKLNRLRNENKRIKKM